jgi:hypothetical protein
MLSVNQAYHNRSAVKPRQPAGRREPTCFTLNAVGHAVVSRAAVLQGPGSPHTLALLPQQITCNLGSACFSPCLFCQVLKMPGECTAVL